jgi:hypothetical protein|tara:strand:- start:20720 stop:23494 length:2775 start_codon:yes stop_codon:yes gene_type:complete
MALRRPDQLPPASSLQDEDIFIAEINPFDAATRKVVRISKDNLLDGYANSAFNLGTGAGFYSSITNNTLQLKSLVGGKDFVVNSSANQIFIDYTGTPESTTASNIGSGIGLFSSVSDYDIKLKSISGRDNIEVSQENDTLFVSFIGQAGGGGNAVSGASFSFFSNIENNIGPATKNYYATPTTGTLLSGVTVDTAEDLKVYLRWDGPAHDYIGSGSINGIPIPSNQIVELGDFTRRFEGYLDNLSLTGQSFISGEANGSSAIISLTELGAGPTPISLLIDNISSATEKPSTELGSTHLKGGDTINAYAVFSSNDIDTIEVYNSGISDGIVASSYSLSDTGDGNFTATIPVTITNNRAGLNSISIIARNSFGTFGQVSTSSNQIDLDQTYPSISASDPSSYNGRNDGLRNGESTNFTNTISNWSAGNGDTISYSALTSDISITNSNSFENPKTVSYADGIYSDSDNLRIRAVRVNNGAVDTDDAKIKIANPPQISAISFDSTATSAQSPNVIGASEVKGGDVINAYIDVTSNESSANQIQLRVLNFGLSEGQSYSNYSSTDLGGGVFRYTVPITVTDEASRNGTVGIKVIPKNSFYNIFGDEFTSNNSVSLNNSNPSVSISSISYPGNQQALKDSESATVSNSASNFDTISYTSANGQLTISNSTTQESSKNVSRQAGNYNISTNNFTITATKTSNGAVSIASTVVKIAHTDLQLSINNLASSLSSSPAGVSDNFNLVSTQQFLEAPDLFTSLSQTSPSQLTTGSQGTNTNSNSYTITVSDSDTKGTFTWRVSGQNLAGKQVNVITTNPDYTLEGFSSRTITASPQSLGAGLASIGTSVSNTSNVNMENISEGGGGPNGGTVYSYQSYSDGIQLSNVYDENNKFTVCDSLGVTSSTGDYIFNLDKLNRAANTSVNNPAQFLVSED